MDLELYTDWFYNHPELQPIEICWGVLKNYIAKNCDFTMENLYIHGE